MFEQVWRYFLSVLSKWGTPLLTTWTSSRWEFKVWTRYIIFRQISIQGKDRIIVMPHHSISHARRWKVRIRLGCCFVSSCFIVPTIRSRFSQVQVRWYNSLDLAGSLVNQCKSCRVSMTWATVNMQGRWASHFVIVALLFLLCSSVLALAKLLITLTLSLTCLNIYREHGKHVMFARSGK